MSFEGLGTRTDYVATGLLDSYDYDFLILISSHLRVTVRNTADEETTLILDTDYEVSGAGNPNGGSITLIDDGQAWINDDGFLTEDYAITLRRVVPLTQPTEIKNQRTFFANVHEMVFDRLTMIAQQIMETLNRAVRLPETVSSEDFDPELPAELPPNTIFAVNDDGDGIEMLEATDIAAFAAQADHIITDGQAATSIEIELDSDSFTSYHYEYEIIRGTTVFSAGRVSFHFRDSAWRVVLGGDSRDDDSAAHGVTFSVTIDDEIAIAADTGAGNGTLKLKKHRFSA